jgi:hypothetical protein
MAVPAPLPAPACRIHCRRHSAGILVYHVENSYGRVAASGRWQTLIPITGFAVRIFIIHYRVAILCAMLFASYLVSCTVLSRNYRLNLGGWRTALLPRRQVNVPIAMHRDDVSREYVLDINRLARATESFGRTIFASSLMGIYG